MRGRRVPERLTQARIDALVAEIHSAARAARQIDPQTKGYLSYPAMCGGLQSIVRNLVRQLAGDAAALAVAEAFDSEWHEDVARSSATELFYPSKEQFPLSEADRASLPPRGYDLVETRPIDAPLAAPASAPASLSSVQRSEAT